MRPTYIEEDNSDRTAYIQSRQDILNKTFVVDLWTKVIVRAIEDLAAYRIQRRIKKKLSEEELIFEASAHGFLFDDNWRIPIDDYKIMLQCSKVRCSAPWIIYISELPKYGKRIPCPYCGYKNNRKRIQAEVIEDQQVKDTSFREIAEAIGINNLTEFRNGCRKRIDEIVQKRLLAKNKKH